MNGIIQHISVHYNIGIPIGALIPISGGRLNKMWKLETNIGKFAIKELNSHNLQKQGVIAKYNASENIAQFISRQDIPVINAIKNYNEQYVSKINDKYIMVFPWVDAQIIKSIELKHIKKIAKILSQIHLLNIHDDMFNSYSLSEIDINNLELLIKRLKNNVSSELVDNFLDIISNLKEDIENALIILNGSVLISHRDLDPKNVLWGNFMPYVIDWEAVGYINPVEELISAALDWSYESIGNFNNKMFVTFIKEYNKYLTIDSNFVESSFYAILNNRLNWLVFNINRFLGEMERSIDEILISKEEIIKSFRSIKDLNKNMKYYCELVWQQLDLI